MCNFLLHARALPVAKRLVCGYGVYKHGACFHHLLQAQKSHTDIINMFDRTQTCRKHRHTMVSEAFSVCCFSHKFTAALLSGGFPVEKERKTSRQAVAATTKNGMLPRPCMETMHALAQIRMYGCEAFSSGHVHRACCPFMAMCFLAGVAMERGACASPMLLAQLQPSYHSP